MFICIACHPIKYFKCKQYYVEHKALQHINSSSNYTCSKCNVQYQLRHANCYHVKKKCSARKVKKMIFCDLFVEEIFFNDTMIFYRDLFVEKNILIDSHSFAFTGVL